jgi:enamine deaminase RidA (YjgF/YER057c/UK114 family)
MSSPSLVMTFWLDIPWLERREGGHNAPHGVRQSHKGERAMKKIHLEPSERQKTRAYSPAVITEGGRVVWLAGQTALEDASGRDLAGDFEAQTRRVFVLMDETLRRAGGTLADLVTMSVFIKEPRHGDRFVEIRRDLFADGRFPASALITVTNFARPGMEIEIQGIAVIPDV